MFAMLRASAQLPVHVRIWMAFMAATFAGHAFFLSSSLLAASLGGFVGALTLAMLVFGLTKNIDSLALTHFAIWPFVLGYGLSEIAAGRGPEAGSLAQQVLYLGYGVFVVSLVLDFKILLKWLKPTTVA